MIITQTIKPHGEGPQNLSACARETDPGVSPLRPLIVQGDHTGATVTQKNDITLMTLCLQVSTRPDSYLLQYCQVLVHCQSISQGSGSKISDSITSKIVEESTPELVQVVKSVNGTVSQA